MFILPKMCWLIRCGERQIITAAHRKKKYGDVQWNIPAYRHLITLKIIVFVYAVIVIVFQIIGRRFCGRLL